MIAINCKVERYYYNTFFLKIKPAEYILKYLIYKLCMLKIEMYLIFPQLKNAIQ